MNIDLSRFKVVYGEKVLNAVALENVMYSDNGFPCPTEKGCVFSPQFLTVLAINADGNIIAICDEALRFQFLPIIKKED